MSMSDTVTAPGVYRAIQRVMADIGSTGIAKDRRNQQQGFSFRGIDDVYNALSGALARHGLCMLPRVLTRASEERQTKSGGTLNYVTVEVEYDLVASEDGTMHTVRAFGEAMDSADKATNKAMSAAYKYAAMQTFCIPTEGDNDADGQSHEVAPRGGPPPEAKGTGKPTPQSASHHPSWSGDQAKFCAALRDQKLTYDEVADYCTATHRPRPSAVDNEGRRKLWQEVITGPGRADLDAFVAAQR
jgi:hypothetical protein